MMVSLLSHRLLIILILSLIKTKSMFTTIFFNIIRLYLLLLTLSHMPISDTNRKQEHCVIF